LLYVKCSLLVLQNILITMGLGLWNMLVSTRLVGKHQSLGGWCTVILEQFVEEG
jgi:hypothetical protein